MLITSWQRVNVSAIWTRMPPPSWGGADTTQVPTLVIESGRRQRMTSMWNWPKPNAQNPCVGKVLNRRVQFLLFLWKATCRVTSHSKAGHPHCCMMTRQKFISNQLTRKWKMPPPLPDVCFVCIHRAIKVFGLSRNGGRS